MTSSAADGRLQFKPKLGILCMLAALAILGSTDAIVKWAAGSIDVVQIAFVRFGVSLLIVLVFMVPKANSFAIVRTRRPIGIARIAALACSRDRTVLLC